MYSVGIDLGGTDIKAGIVNASRKILVQRTVSAGAGRPWREVIKDMAYLVLELADSLGLNPMEIPAVGIGAPGTVDRKTGVVRYSNNLGWQNVPLMEEMHRYFSCPVAVANDADCAALGEVKAGAAKNVDSVLMITLGTGVGGGIIIGGRIFEGIHSGGAEIGHTLLVMDGEPCTCGRRGCVEAYVSAMALVRETRRAAAEHPESLIHKLCGRDPERINGKTPFDAAQMGDPAARQVVDRYIRCLGEAIIDYVNIMRPDMVLIGGGVSRQGKNLTDPVNEYIRGRCFGGANAYVPEVAAAALGNNAGVIGASCLVDGQGKRG